MTLYVNVLNAFRSNYQGPKVISKSIPVSSVEELASVLQRPPVIWDNLHANDYDQRRLFLGPYEGRSVALIPRLNGVMTNPNCEYGANYVPIHTLAQWSRCGSTVSKRMSPTDQAMLLEMEKTQPSDVVFDGKKALSGQCESSSDELCVYDPKLALEASLKEWFLEIQVPRKKPEHYKPVKSATSIAKAVDAEQLGFSKRESEEDTMADSPLSADLQDKLLPKMTPASPSTFTMDDLRLLVDYFFLPHCHGDRAMHVLEEFCWLKENAPGYELLRMNGLLVDSDEESGHSRSQEKGLHSGSQDGMRSDGETSESLTGDDMSCVEVGC